ncbi:DUF3306 domain-containing protein [Mesorhizobium sp. KR2-14]|uniref:DUF3306 domain-containing protein n=1 Tax=Mesorhizobium sp. KR2-14 TaxID=3156610 RepID=UPI0032B33D81
MTDHEGIFARWSRLKRQAAEETPQTGEPESTKAEDEAMQAADVAATEEASVDLSQLPSLDAIDATTDLRAFLAAGVPSELRNAALRKAWSADPAIRDFIGPNENFWDHTTGRVAGFGMLKPATARRLMAQVLGDDEPAEARMETTATPAQQPVAPQPDRTAPPVEAESVEVPPPDDNSEASAKAEKNEPGVRRHGGAFPRFKGD